MPDYPKRHHVVPAFYLRGFAQSEQLTAIRLADGGRFTTPVHKAASETHFYRLAPDHRSGPFALEGAFSSVEGEAATIIDRMASGDWPLSFHERRHLSFFVTFQLLRGPRYRDALRVSGASGRNADGSVMTTIDMHAHRIATLSEEWMPQLMGRPWDLIRFTEGALITSDSPVSSIRPLDYDSRCWDGAPFAVAEEVLFPVARKIGLRMNKLSSETSQQQLAASGVLDRAGAGSLQLAKRFNDATAETATKHLFHHPSDARAVPRRLWDNSAPE